MLKKTYKEIRNEWGDHDRPLRYTLKTKTFFSVQTLEFTLCDNRVNKLQPHAACALPFGESIQTVPSQHTHVLGG